MSLGLRNTPKCIRSCGIACAGDGLALLAANRPYFSMRRPKTDLAKKTPGFRDQCGRPSSRRAVHWPDSQCAVASADRKTFEFWSMGRRGISLAFAT
jgi:hypothetical protein